MKVHHTHRRTAWNRRLTPEMESSFEQDYVAGMTSPNIARKYGYKTAKTVLDVLAKRGVPRLPAGPRTYYDETFFDQIDDHDKAYMLGMLMTDGYIVRDYAGFGIQLTESDGYILWDFARILNSQHGPYRIDYSKQRLIMPGARDCSRFEIKNRKLATALKRLGVVRRKTKILRYRNVVPNEFLSSFFRGLLDGDGNITITERPLRFECTLVSASKCFLVDLQKALSGRFVATIHQVSPTKLTTTPTYLLRIKGGYEEGKRFATWIYEQKTSLMLKRKYAKVQDKIS